MRVVLQRVTRASVSSGGEALATIGPGLVALVGVADGDGPEEAARLAEKTVRLRLFPGDERPFDRTLPESGGGLLCVSQFTLLADVRRGNRPSWAAAAAPELAAPLVEAYADAVEARGVAVGRGRFGAMMSVELVNDGPVTVILDSEDLARVRRGGG